MPGTASYRTCAGPSRDKLRVKGSRFLALLEPCADRTEAEGMLAKMQQNRYGTGAAIIGEIVSDHPGRVIMKTRLGSSRIVDMPVGELLPRIC